MIEIDTTPRVYPFRVEVIQAATLEWLVGCDGEFQPIPPLVGVDQYLNQYMHPGWWQPQHVRLSNC